MKRVLTALFLIPLLIVFLIYAPDIWLLFFILIINFIALSEYFGVAPHVQDKGFFFLTITSGLLLNIGGYYWNERGLLGLLYISLFTFFIYGLSRRNSFSSTINGIGFGISGVLYISLLLSYLLLIGLLDSGRKLLIFILVIIWSIDTAAYYVGKRWGKRRLAPIISPNKTILGAFAGLIGGITGSLAFWILFFRELPAHYVILVSMGMGVLGQLSDLSESLFKRWAGVKDTGSILPGHGGMLDRIDSLLFTSPFVYYITRFILPF